LQQPETADAVANLLGRHSFALCGFQRNKRLGRPQRPDCGLLKKSSCLFARVKEFFDPLPQWGVADTSLGKERGARLGRQSACRIEHGSFAVKGVAHGLTV
jgi:hypothetical protein